jgi:hypothetical protein
VSKFGISLKQIKNFSFLNSLRVIQSAKINQVYIIFYGLFQLYCTLYDCEFLEFLVL